MERVFDPRYRLGRRNHLCKEGRKLRKQLLFFLPFLKVDGTIPNPIPAGYAFKWLTIKIQINKIIKMEKLVREKFSRG